MMRTVWLATIFLAVLGALAVGKALRTPADSIVPEVSTDQMTVGTGLTQNALRKADWLEINYARQEILPTAVQPTDPIVPAVSSVPQPVETKILSRHWHDPQLSSSAVKPKKAKQTSTDKKSKAVDRKGKQRIVLNQQNR
jgi:hypothetical protein